MDRTRRASSPGHPRRLRQPGCADGDGGLWGGAVRRSLRGSRACAPNASSRCPTSRATTSTRPAAAETCSFRCARTTATRSSIPCARSCGRRQASSWSGGRSTASRAPHAGPRLEVRGIDEAGDLDQGLLFIAFNQAIDRQFATIQGRLGPEPMVDYITPVGGGYFFAPRGTSGPGDWVGSGLISA